MGLISLSPLEGTMNAKVFESAQCYICAARIRDLKKAKYGNHTVEKRIREGSRAYEYRLGI